MSAARTALDELSQDPEVARLARRRSDELKLNEISLAHAKREGEAKGEAKGKREGKREGKIEALLAVLAARGLAVSEDAKTRIAAEKDPAVLDRWLTRAITVASVPDLFLPDPQA